MTKQNNQQANPFMDMFKQFGDMPNMQQMQNMMPKMPDFGKMPQFDHNPAMKAVNNAGKTMMESTQAIMRRQAEMVQEVTGKAFQSAKACSSVSNTQDMTAQTMACVKENLQNMMQGIREVAQISSQASLEAYDALAGGLTESLNSLGQKNS
jgi:hypothetical protein